MKKANNVSGDFVHFVLQGDRCYPFKSHCQSGYQCVRSNGQQQAQGRGVGRRLGFRRQRFGYIIQWEIIFYKVFF